MNWTGLWLAQVGGHTIIRVGKGAERVSKKTSLAQLRQAQALIYRSCSLDSIINYY